MELIYYTLVGLGLYVASDWILNRIETRRGERFEQRTLIFFGIILLLSLIVFRLIRHLQ